MAGVSGPISAQCWARAANQSSPGHEQRLLEQELGAVVDDGGDVAQRVLHPGLLQQAHREPERGVCSRASNESSRSLKLYNHGEGQDKKYEKYFKSKL